ncbi:MAG: prepilin peptidase [bacterium]
MDYLFYILVFSIGVSVGSFLNVLILRLSHDEGIGGRSACPKCGHQLAWHDLIPVFSFIFLRGRCRYCGMKISWQYPIVELVTGILFVLIFSKFFPLGGTISQFPNFPISGLLFTVYCLLLTSCLIVIFVSDLKYFIIPDKVIIVAVMGTLLYKLFEILDFGYWDLFGIWDLGFGIWRPSLFSLLSAVGACVFFLLIVLVTRGRGMGLGDVKMAFLMGLVLGWPKILPVLLLAFVSGALVGLALIVAGRAKMKSEIPFGTFLSVSTFFMLIWGSALFGWYLDYLF